MSDARDFPMRRVDPATDAAWRELPDPKYAGCVWRCRDLQLEWTWRGENCVQHQGWWYALTRRPVGSNSGVQEVTPEREAVWLDLFLHP